MNKRFKLFLVLLFVAIGVLFIKPSYQWYFGLNDAQRTLANGSKESIREYAQQKAAENTAALQNDFEENRDADLSEDLGFLQTAAKKIYKDADVDVPAKWSVSSVVKAFFEEGDTQEDTFSRVRREAENHYIEEVNEQKGLKTAILQRGLDIAGGMSVVLEIDKSSIPTDEGKEPTKEQIEDAVRRAMEVLQNKIDTFGLTEPQIRRQGEEQILIEIPGDYDPTVVDSFLMGRGSLNFHIVDYDKTSELLQKINTNPAEAFKDGKPYAPEILGENYIALGEYKKDRFGIDQFQNYVVVEKEAGLSGSYIESATVYRDQVSFKPKVAFNLTSEGGDIFYQFTSANEKKPMAVVMDDKVKSIATIQEPIRSNVSVTGFDDKEANDLALILRTAAMPVTLNIVNLQQVGAQLGDDTIDSGLNAIFVGFVAVMVFMLAYYLGAGIIANIALLLNLFFIVAILSQMNMTLTMTSIAGLILNVGMAVDANVIIFERIKEELRLGKTRASAIATGFQRAFWTIIDANITTLIAALFLSQLGKGPVKGFAVTLAVGIVCSLFTALFVSRLFFDFGTEVAKRKKVSIGWGVK